MMGYRMSWLFALTILCFTSNCHSSSASAPGKKKLPSSIVVGTVYCDTCFENGFSKSSHFISGALVAVECDRKNSEPRFREEVKTNRHGEFKVHLPFSVSKHAKKIEKCSVTLIRSSEANCAVASTAQTSSLHLKSRKPGKHIFSAGFFTFKPLTQPNLCNQKPDIKNSNKLLKTAKSSHFDTSFPPPLRDPPSSFLPPIDDPGQFAPFPILPRLPPLPQLPINLPPLFPPKKATNSKPSNDLLNQKTFFPFPPNPFQPPLIPNPLQPPPAILPPIIPSPPPSIFPPIFPSQPPSLFPPVLPTPPQPPPSIFPPIFPAPPSPPPSFFPPNPFFPPIPGFSPPALPPPSPPSIPFLPLPPGFPGVPPAATSKNHP